VEGLPGVARALPRPKSAMATPAPTAGRVYSGLWASKRTWRVWFMLRQEGRAAPWCWGLASLLVAGAV